MTPEQVKEQFYAERHMLQEAESARVRARFDLLDAVNAVRSALKELSWDMALGDGDAYENLLGNIERQADNYARKAQELGNIEGRQGK